MPPFVTIQTAPCRIIISARTNTANSVSFDARFMMASDDLAKAIIASASRLGIDPSDLATAISYETAGTFDPWKAGPTTQHGQHRGLIQWGEPQRKKYGVTEGMPVAGQLEAVERYLTDAGVRPGMKMLDIYSAINAGRVGRYGASDANNGGAPGTVADKVASQMVGHRMKANALLGGKWTPSPSPATALAQGAAPPTTAPAAAVPADAAAAFNPMIAAAAQASKKEPEVAPMMQIAHPEQEMMRRAKLIQAALARQRGAAGGVIGG